MNESEVADLVARELAGRISSKHGWNFTRCLVHPPERAILKTVDDRPLALWIVLREANSGGYAIGYDDDDRSFQLVTAVGAPVGQYGTLMEAIDGM